ncbi:AlpA family transcriptional regulator [Brucella pseudogrignonensis]|uniref:helix-turn-helix transcriptional regulator n=1 Tax=Brucella pseudogrignonensis TaxID=419475 RepID=UPI0028B55E8A|nr:AlpA family transcriptional regulator [Brucella pseudogrignonensis]MDT6941809.1 AlpA family transcriptional regulator [Brucella pseudogrignonensis]
MHTDKENLFSDITGSPINFRLLALPEVMRLTGLGRATIYKWMSEGRFPQSLKLGGSSVRWRSDEMEYWISTLPRH